MRPQIDVGSPAGGWPYPWPDVAELAAVLPADRWTLVGGLMVQLHTVHAGVGIVRPTNDVDIVLHIEIERGVPRRAAEALESIGYRLQAAVDPRDNTAHRWVRQGQIIDITGGVLHAGSDDLADERRTQQVDVLAADHSAPAVVETMRGRDMVRIEGGTQALKRTINAVLSIEGHVATLSVPRPFAAVILKAAAYTRDSRDRDRHLYDAAALLACIEDPFAEIGGLGGSDRGRLHTLAKRLPDTHPAWQALSTEDRTIGQASLRVLAAA